MASIAAVIPAYNCGKTLDDTLKAIRDQATPCDEIIVVDDGSIDDTQDIIKKYNDVTYVYQNNAGVSAARNNGVARSKCEWIAFCDADDIWHREKICVTKETISALNKFKFFFHNFDIFVKELPIKAKGVADTDETIFPIFNENKLKLKNILKDHHNIHITRCNNWHTINIYAGNPLPWLIYGNFVLPSSIVIEKEHFLKLGGFDNKFRSAEETEFCLRFSKHSEFAFIDAPLAYYRQTVGGLTGNIPVLVENAMAALNKNFGDTRYNTKYKKHIKTAVSRRYRRLAYYWISEIRPENARETALNGIKKAGIDLKLLFLYVTAFLPEKILITLKKMKAKI